MSKLPLLIDTNIAIHLLKGTSEIVEFLDEREVYISFITEVELLSWAKLDNQETGVVEEFIKNCNYLDYTFQIKNTAIDIIKIFRLKIPDAFIAATASYYHFPLFTS